MVRLTYLVKGKLTLSPVENPHKYPRLFWNTIYPKESLVKSFARNLGEYLRYRSRNVCSSFNTGLQTDSPL